MRNIPPQTISMQFGQSIRLARKKKGWTSRFLSELAKISQGYVTHIEVDGWVPSIPVIMRLCQILALDQDKTLAQAGYDYLRSAQ